MAVKLEGSIKRYIGDSLDTKPFIGQQLDGSREVVAERDLPPGSSFLEEDTGRIWRWNGSEWTHPKDVHDSALEVVLSEVRDVRHLLESFIVAATS